MFKDINFSVCCSYLTGLEALVHTDPICSQVSVLCHSICEVWHMIHCYTNMRYIYYSLIRIAMVQRSLFLFLTTVCYSPVTCTPVNLPSFMATSPVTPSSSSTMASSKLAPVGSTDHLKQFAVPSATVWFLCWRCSHCYFFFSSVAPDTINNHVKTCREEQKSLHFFAPEYGGEVLRVYRFMLLRCAVVFLWYWSGFRLLSAVANVTTAVDIYSFGMCALEVRRCLFLLLAVSHLLCCYCGNMSAVCLKTKSSECSTCYFCLKNTFIVFCTITETVVDWRLLFISWISPLSTHFLRWLCWKSKVTEIRPMCPKKP